MSIQSAWQEHLDFFGARPIVIEPSRASLSSDAGLLPIRQFDEQWGFTRAFAAALDDPRAAEFCDHSFSEMVRSRIYGILADYEDQNDHDTLRHDAVFKLIAGRSPNDAPLASQPTLSRFENAISIASLKRLRDFFIDQFIASFVLPPRRLTIDLDAVDDPAHGAQQLTFWHGFYDQNQYLPLVITCADNDQFLMVSLRPGIVHAALGADDDLAYLVRRLRQTWPDVELIIRGDGGFGVPWMYDVCERSELLYTFGLSTNKVLKRRSEALLAEAVQRFEQTGQPQRLFAGFWYQAQSWPFPRWVIVKAEANAQGTNRRFIVSNRPGAYLLWEAAYDDYAQRGESENRNKEFKCDLAMDRLSDHRFLANYFRLYLHAAAMNLLVRLRRQVAEPTAADPEADVPVEALAGEQRRRHFRLRRQRDPLGEGQPCTWRTLLIKVAAEVIVSSRRIVVRLSSSWPHLDYFRHVCERLRPLPVSGSSSG
jgi:Transposase DDE domain group 1